jgi:hypothetical protein
MLGERAIFRCPTIAQTWGTKTGARVYEPEHSLPATTTRVQAFPSRFQNL